MTALTTRVWQRYGQLRIYVFDGPAQVGWCDPRSGRFQLSSPERQAEFWAAVRAESQRLLQDGRLGHVAIPSSPARPPASHPVVRDPGWDDLARTAPGASASAHARELRRDHRILTTAAGLLGIRTKSRSFAMGAAGERTVGRKLNQWAPRHGWQVLHAVPVGQRGADIDHVVIGPFGVVTVNTKATRHQVWVGEQGMKVGGQTVDYLRKSRAEARRAGQLLGRATGTTAPVQAVIVFVGPRRFTVQRGGPADVAVLPAPRALRTWLRKQPRVLDAGQVEAIYAAARRPATWQRRPPPAR